MSHDTQVKQEDEIERFTTIGYSEFVNGGMRPMFDGEWVRYSDHQAALATVRREAFKEAITLVQSVTNENDLDDGGFFEAGFIAARTKSIDVLIAASATEKGETNG